MPATNDPDDAVLQFARQGNRKAMEQVIAASYPAVVRMARALTGQESAARRVVTGVIGRGLRVMPTWREGIAPENWFYHHTLLVSRAERRPVPTNDDLLVATTPSEAEYPAYIQAIRQLPVQQSEAYLLNVGQRLNERLLGVAMDCSTAAAANHLRAACTDLAALFGERLAILEAALQRRYNALTPAPGAIAAIVSAHVARHLRPRRRRLMRWILVLAIVAAAAYLAWRWRITIRHGLSR